MAHRNATLIFNPNAGSWEWDSAIQALSGFWQRRGWSVSLEPTKYAGHATELARRAACSGRELVFAAGGDGTLNEVANGLAFTDTIMAPVPVGTANSFAKELGIPTGSRTKREWFVDTLEALAAGDVRQMDLGLCNNGRYWLLWAGMGIDGWLIDRIEPRSRLFKRFGAFGYGLKSFVLMPRFHGVSGTVEVDEQTVDGDFLMVNVSNCRLYAGGELELNRGAVLDDGLFEVWIFKGTNWYSLLRYIALAATGRHERDPGVSLMIGKRVTVQTSYPTPFHLDAEPAGMTPFSCEVQRGALRLLTPHGTRAGLFGLPGISLSDWMS